ncbi:MAG: putative selenate ABC transporter substrate-binding protein [Planctomycetota bacterium]
MRTLMILAVLGLFGSVVGLSACSDQNDSEKVLRFTAIPDDDTTLLRQKYEPIAEYLSKKLGIKVEYVPVADYSAAVTAFKNGDVQLAWFGGLTGVQARHAVEGARAIAQGTEDPEYFSYFIAHKDTGLTLRDEFPMEMAGKRFTFGSQSSTSGRLMPEHFIRKFGGKKPKDFFSEINFSGAHDKTCELVQSGAWEFGGVSYTTYDKMVKSGKIDPDVCRIVWKTPIYPDYNFTAHPDLEKTFEAGFTDRLQKALVAMTDKKLLSAFLRSGLIPATNSDFERIEMLARELDFVR